MYRKHKSFGLARRNVTPRVKAAFGGLIDTQVYPTSVKNFLNAHGDEKVTKITLAREPVNSKVRSFLNTISLGLLDKAVKRVGHDQLFHLFAIIQTDKGTYRIEKNQTLSMKSGGLPSSSQAQILPINFSKDITLGEMIENTRKKMGDKSFFEYDGFSKNCQDFIKNLLTANGITAPSKFIDQDASSIAKSLPGYVPTVTKGITDLAAVLDIFTQKLGLNLF